MHSSVFEVSRKPVPASEQVRAGNLPDWFYEQICDYAENTGPEQRQKAISQFCGALGGWCSLDGDGITISPQVKKTFFRKSYSDFKEAAAALVQTDYETFSEGHTAPALSAALDSLNSSYEDKRGVYIYLFESGKLVTLNHWIRTADFSQPFYIGGIIKFHC